MLWCAYLSAPLDSHALSIRSRDAVTAARISITHLHSDLRERPSEKLGPFAKAWPLREKTDFFECLPWPLRENPEEFN
jgi:hypothetical protein